MFAPGHVKEHQRRIWRPLGHVHIPRETLICFRNTADLLVKGFRIGQLYQEWETFLFLLLLRLRGLLKFVLFIGMCCKRQQEQQSRPQHVLSQRLAAVSYKAATTPNGSTDQKNL